jgi:hypothetical protein
MKYHTSEQHLNDICSILSMVRQFVFAFLMQMPASACKIAGMQSGSDALNRSQGLIAPIFILDDNRPSLSDFNRSTYFQKL